MRFREKFSWCCLVATPYTQNKVREFKRERERDRLKLFEKKREKGKKRDKNCTVAKLPSRTVSLCLNCSNLELVKMREKETNNKISKCGFMI